MAAPLGMDSPRAGAGAPRPSSPRRRGPAGPGRAGPPRAGRAPGRDRPRGDPPGRRPGGRPGDADSAPRFQPRGLARVPAGPDGSSPVQGTTGDEPISVHDRESHGGGGRRGGRLRRLPVRPDAGLAVFVAAGLGLAGYLLREDLAYLLDRGLDVLGRPVGRPGWSCCGSGSSRRPAVLFYDPATYAPNRRGHIERDPREFYQLFSDDVAYVAASRTWDRTVANLLVPHNTHIVPAWRLVTWGLVACAGNLRRLPEVLATGVVRDPGRRDAAWPAGWSRGRRGGSGRAWRRRRWWARRR